MEDRILNEKESLELITQMIRNTKNKMQANRGVPFLIWGYTTIIISVLMWYISVSTRNYEWQWLWFMLPLVGWTGTYIFNRNSPAGIKTYIDRIISYLWIVLGAAGVFVSCLRMFFYLPILFVILLIMGMGTILTGLIIKYKFITVCGILGTVSSAGCLCLHEFNQIPVFALVIIFIMVIPGHILNHAGRKQKKL